jgi:hypothetical protein
MSNKHFRPDETPVDLPDDLERNPGIGQSKGLFARTAHDDMDLIMGENTIEGDTDNDAGAAGGINPKLGRDH